MLCCDDCVLPEARPAVSNSYKSRRVWPALSIYMSAWAKKIPYFRPASSLQTIIIDFHIAPPMHPEVQLLGDHPSHLLPFHSRMPNNYSFHSAICVSPDHPPRLVFPADHAWRSSKLRGTVRQRPFEPKSRAQPEPYRWVGVTCAAFLTALHVLAFLVSSIKPVLSLRCAVALRCTILLTRRWTWRRIFGCRAAAAVGSL